jgi:hypothetical protein
MLQMDCPNCKGVIKSHFLADVSSVECDHCHENITVKDVFITTKYFTIHRDDFLNRTFRFQKLLREVEKELLFMAKAEDVSTKSLESLKQFYASLQELLAGTRDSYRMELACDLYVEVDDQGRKCKGRLLNLSTTGGSIELLEFDKIPRKKSELKIQLTFPEFSEQLCIQARVVWTKEQIKETGTQCTIMGVTFVDLEETARSCIWNFILDNSPVKFK